MTRPLAPGTEIAGYRTEQVLGEGGMGTVYRALQRSLGRPVALKVIARHAADPEARQRFRREAELQAGLTHPHVVAVHEAGEAPEGLYIAMQLVPDGTLREVIGDGLDPERALALLGPIAGALDAAHAAGLVHRDVKPRNILLDGDRALLADFGLVRSVEGSAVTEPGSLMGTPNYVAPEQVRGQAPTIACDVYGLAAVLYECLTGTVVFPVDTVEAALYAHVHEAPMPASTRRAGLPPALDAVLDRGLAKDPGARPPSAGALIDALRSALAGATPAPGATLTAGAARRLVTVLCARLEVGDDPEVSSVALSRWRVRAAAVVARHGGVVQPAEDQLVAVFGLDRLHEDDAARAVRAAEELQGAAVAIGVEAGQVLVDHAVTGAPLRLAGALAQAAGGGEIRLGDTARELAGLAIAPPPTAFVGREADLDGLSAEIALARAQAGCRMVTVLGAAGLGKSRLARELIERLDGEATVLVGRCPPSGEGLTYRPLAEMVEQLPERELASSDDAERILMAAGAIEGTSRPEETAWSARRLFERAAAQRPLLVVIEDAHWAQPPLLDLLDHVAGLSTGVPITLLCLARPELIDARPAWAVPQPNRTLIALEPLAPVDAERLVAARGGADPARAAEIVATADGNPLFLEQLLTVGAGALPPTVQAVLAARIDALEPDARDVLERASVLGRRFPVAALQPAPALSELLALVRAQLLAPEPPRAPDQDAFRFAHALVRDAAYEGITRRRRAELHEEAAAWVAGRDGEPDREALAGRHLEAAHRHRVQLGEDDRDLARRAAGHLRRAAEDSHRRGDLGSAVAFLERARTLIAEEPGDLLAQLGMTLLESGRLDEAEAVLDAAADQAKRMRDPVLEASVAIEQQFLRSFRGDELTATRQIAEAAVVTLERAGNLLAACRARQLIAWTTWNEGRNAQTEAEWQRAAALARAAGDERTLFEIHAWSASALASGPVPVPEAIERIRDLRDEVPASPLPLALIDRALAQLYAFAGDAARSRELTAAANATLDQLGGLLAGISHHEAIAEAALGAYDRAERRLRADRERLEAIGERALFSTTVALLAYAVQQQGRHEEAERLAAEARDAAADGDVATQSLYRGVQARALAHRGQHEEAEALVREAVRLLEPSDALVDRGDVALMLADVLRAGGRVDEAREAQREAVRLYDRKGAIVLAERARRLESAS